MDDLMSDFIAETRETLEAVAGELVAWEADPSDRARLDAIFRFVHTVKGSCGFLDLPRLQRLSHAAEDALGDVRDGRRVADARLVSGVLAIIDRIAEVTDAIASGEGLPDAEDHVMIAALEAGAELLPAPSIAQPSRVVARSIRVPVDLLDRMMAGVSELVLARNELARRLREIGPVSEEPAFERLSATIGDLRDMVTRTRMARVDSLFAALPRLVRDLSVELRKQVVLRVDGGEVELDREMIEMIRDPLTHIVRNAIDHGIEPPTDRIARGKPAAGTLALAARQSGNQILIEVMDDGAGIDGDRLAQKAVTIGLVTAEEAERMSWAQKLEFMFHPGLSTAQAVTAVSGRGVGMDVVRANVERIGGLVTVESRRGVGVRLSLRVPMTLTIIPALTVSAAGQMFALPRSAIEEIVRADAAAVTIASVGGARIATVRGERLPVVSLSTLLGAGDEVASLLVVLKPAGTARFALAVTAVHDHEELVVKPAAPAIMAVGLYAGATLPDDNRPMLLLDPPGLAAAAGVVGGTEAAPAADADTPVRAVGEPALVFVGLDGHDRAVRLPLVERIEDVPAEAVRMIGGRLRLALDGLLMPLLARSDLPTTGKLRILRMTDGAAQVALPIRHVVDIADLPAATVPGVVLLDGRPIELIDAHRVFADADVAPAARKVVLLAGGGEGWMREVLRPMLQAAGYRVAVPGEAGDEIAADIVITTDADAAPNGTAAPLLRLRTHAAGGGDGSIWRYDGAGLLDALARGTGRG